MKVLQHNLNHYEAAQDLLMQTVRDWKIDLVVITGLNNPLRTNQWASDATGKTASGIAGNYYTRTTLIAPKKAL